MTTSLAAKTLTLGYGGVPIIDGLSLEVLAGKITAIVGANACGKSTLLRGLARLQKPSAGTVLLDGADIHGQPSRAVAQKLGILPQMPQAPAGITVAELVERGRTPHRGPFGRRTRDDDDAVARALRETGTLELAERAVDDLSGGQRQRVWIAMALAQETDVLLLDEPTTYLDLAHQVEVLELLRRLNAERGTTVVMVLHELNLAARYADHLVAMTHGAIVAQGVPSETLDAELVRRVFGLEALVVPDPVSGTPLVVPLGGYPHPAHPGVAETLSGAQDGVSQTGVDQPGIEQRAVEAVRG